MRWPHQLAMKLRMLFARGRSTAQLDDELRFHLERQIEENRASGMSLEEARAAALRTFGNPALLRDQTRAAWSWNSLESLLRDLRIGLRTLRRTPGFTFVAIAVIALCIGASTSLFTVVRSVLLRPLPFRDPSHLVMIYEHFRAPELNQPTYNFNPVAPADYYDWRSQNQTSTHGFADMAIWRYAQFNLTGEKGDLPEQVDARGASANLFPLLGVDAAIGRTFTESEDRTDGDVALLTWSLFERRFGGDPSIVGRQIHLDDKPYTVVGVLPRNFTYPDSTVQLWVPYRSGMPPAVLAHHDFHFSRVVARLKPGVSLASAISQVDALQYRIHMQYLSAPVAEDAVSRDITEDLARDVRKPLLLLMGAVGCMLLIGCLNVANLLVARSAARQKEVAIRGALGASRWTLIREQLIESLLISLAGGVLGVALSLSATRWLAHAWKELPTAQSIHVDGAVLAFACALVLAAALLSGLLPAISSTAKSVFATLQTAARTTGSSLSRTTLRKALLTIEISVTVVLLIAAGLLLKSFVRLRTTGVGADTANLLTLDYSLPDQKYPTQERKNAFNEALLARLRALPGVRAVALGNALPGAGYGGDDIFLVAEHPPIPPGSLLPDAMNRIADPGYFQALGIPLLRGRFFTTDDRGAQGQKMIISRLLAEKYFPGEDPIGKHMHVPAWDQPGAPPNNFEVVGEVGDTLWQVGQPSMATMYVPVFQSIGEPMGYALAVRTASDPLAISVPVQKQIAALDPQLPVSDVLTMDQVIGRSLGSANLSATLVLAFAVLSLLLASVGLYGVLSYLAAQRTVEIGVRIALGAQREQVLRLMLFDGLRPALLGLVLGLAAGAAAVRLIRSLLYETQPLDPAVFAAVAALLLLVAALACLAPAWRASRLDPMQALRTE
ncbi:MAG TPA: ABC transporter permease [Terracidiphilus sp.]|nr:ABC transporter permease [Terracidiphilus sp.]